MKVNLILKPVQDLNALKEWQAESQEPFFILDGAGQRNVLVLGPVSDQFKEPVTYNGLHFGSHLQGRFVLQIDFKYNDLTEENLPKLLGDNAVLAQDAKGKGAGMLWLFWHDQRALDTFLDSQDYKELQSVISDPYITNYQQQ
ncbi:hypothetical protein PUF88_00340 [Lactobacillaceae bacterium L1_55_11]|nr:hypothetical protein [Lactobacillaceae bacterium L1_55_11]